MGCTGEDGQPRCYLTRVFCLSLRVAVIIIAVIDLLFFLSYISYSGFRVAQSQYVHSASIFIGDIIEGLTHLGVAIILIVGIYKERRQLLRAWIWTRSVVLVTDVSTLLVASSIHVAVADTENLEYSGPFNQIIFCIVLIPFYTAFIIIVRSYALELKAKDNLSPATGAARITSDDEGNEVMD